MRKPRPRPTPAPKPCPKPTPQCGSNPTADAVKELTHEVKKIGEKLTPPPPPPAPKPFVLVLIKRAREEIAPASPEPLEATGSD